MSSDPHPLGPLYRVARRAGDSAFVLLYRVRRATFIARIRTLAAWHRAKIELHVAPDVRIARGVRVEVSPRVRMRIHIGEGVRIDEGVCFLLKGGRLDCGAGTWLRRHVLLNVSGDLTFGERNIMSWGTTVHCAESVHLDAMVGAAEGVTISDSSHFFTTPDTFFYANTRTKPIVIGANTWLCPRSTVTPGVRIGSYCILASNSVAIADVPDGHLASGVPARDVRPLTLPWREPDLAEAMSNAD